MVQPVSPDGPACHSRWSSQSVQMVQPVSPDGPACHSRCSSQSLQMIQPVTPDGPASHSRWSSQSLQMIQPVTPDDPASHFRWSSQSYHRFCQSLQIVLLLPHNVSSVVRAIIQKDIFSMKVGPNKFVTQHLHLLHLHHTSGITEVKG